MDPDASPVPSAVAPKPSSALLQSQSFVCVRNLGLFEGLSAAIRIRSLPYPAGQQGLGLTSTDAKLVTGALSKRAYKLTCEFVNTFKYPLEKFQDGKQQRFRVRDKHFDAASFQAAPRPSVPQSLSAKARKAKEDLVQPSATSSSMDCFQETAYGSSACPLPMEEMMVMNMDGRLEREEQGTVMDGGLGLGQTDFSQGLQWTEAAETATDTLTWPLPQTGTLTSPESVSEAARKREIKLDKDGLMLTAQQFCREQMAVDFLRSCGGGAPRVRVEGVLRTAGKAPSGDGSGQAGSRMDIRTIRRSLSRLLEAGSITEVVGHTDKGDSVSLLLLSDVLLECPDLKDRVLQQMQSEAIRASEPSDGTDGQSVRSRKRRRAVTPKPESKIESETAQRELAVHPDLIEEAANYNSQIQSHSEEILSDPLVPAGDEVVEVRPSKRRRSRQSLESLHFMNWTAEDLDPSVDLTSSEIPGSVRSRLVRYLTQPPGPLLCALGLHRELFHLQVLLSAAAGSDATLDRFESVGGELERMLPLIRARFILLHFPVYALDEDSNPDPAPNPATDLDSQPALTQEDPLDDLLSAALDPDLDMTCKEFIDREVESIRYILFYY